MAGRLALALWLLAVPAAADALDWEAIAAPDVVRIVTLDPDGDVRATKVWIAAADGAAWLRTSNSRWLANIRRDPDVRLRSGDREFALRAEEVSDAATRERVDAAMRAKYGWADRLLAPLRWRSVHVLRLGARRS